MNNDAITLTIPIDSDVAVALAWAASELGTTRSTVAGYALRCEMQRAGFLPEPPKRNRRKRRGASK